MPIVLKSGSLKLLEPSGPVQACNGIALLRFINIYANWLGEQLLFVLEHVVHTFFAINLTKKQTTRRHTLEDSNLTSHCHENLECHTETLVPAENSNQIPRSLRFTQALC